MSMDRRERGVKRELSLMFQEITPPHGWKQDSDFHYLRLTLPGFEAKDITIHMDKYGHLVVRGNRQVSEHKYISFEETFVVPDDARLEDGRGMFEDGQIYNVAIPKVKDQQHAIAMPKPKDHHHNNNKDPKAHDHKTDGNGNGNGASIHQYNNNQTQQGASQRTSRDYLKDIRGDNSKKKKIACLIAILIALLAITVILIVVALRRRK